MKPRACMPSIASITRRGSTLRDSPARERHDTKRAELIASFLQLEKGARMSVQRDRANSIGARSLRRLETITRSVATPLTARSRSPSRPSPTIASTSVARASFSGLACARHPGHDHARLGIEAPRAPREPQTFRVGAIGHRAGVDDIDVGGLVELAALHARARRAATR